MLPFHGVVVESKLVQNPRAIVRYENIGDSQEIVEDLLVALLCPQTKHFLTIMQKSSSHEGGG